MHTVTYGDTLEGLSLQYNIPTSKIKSWNNLTSDEIYFCKTLIIPDPCEPISKIDPEDYEELRRKSMIHSFRNQMEINDRDDKTAVYYLSEGDWDMKKAFKIYKEDLEWEKKNPSQQPQNPYLVTLKKRIEGRDLGQKKRQ